MPGKLRPEARLYRIQGLLDNGSEYELVNPWLHPIHMMDLAQWLIGRCIVGWNPGEDDPVLPIVMTAEAQYHNGEKYVPMTRLPDGRIAGVD